MKLLISFLLLCFMQNLSAQAEDLKVTDATKADSLTVKKNWNVRYKYVEGFIFNKDYVIFQTRDSLFVQKTMIMVWLLIKMESITKIIFSL